MNHVRNNAYYAARRNGATVPVALAFAREVDANHYRPLYAALDGAFAVPSGPIPRVEHTNFLQAMLGVLTPIGAWARRFA